MTIWKLAYLAVSDAYPYSRQGAGGFTVVKGLVLQNQTSLLLGCKYHLSPKYPPCHQSPFCLSSAPGMDSGTSGCLPHPAERASGIGSLPWSTLPSPPQRMCLGPHQAHFLKCSLIVHFLMQTLEFRLAHISCLDEKTAPNVSPCFQ